MAEGRWRSATVLTTLSQAGRQRSFAGRQEDLVFRLARGVESRQPPQEGPMAKKIVYVDMDNVLVDFGSALPRLEKKARKEYKGRLDDVPGIFSLMDPPQWVFRKLSPGQDRSTHCA